MPVPDALLSAHDRLANERYWSTPHRVLFATCQSGHPATEKYGVHLSCMGRYTLGRMTVECSCDCGCRSR